MLDDFHRLYLSATADDIALASFGGLCAAYAVKARRALRARLHRERRTPQKAAGPLLTAREAAPLIGPSWTARKLYRITPTLPPGCAVRKGGRLYYVAPTLREWAARQ